MSTSAIRLNERFLFIKDDELREFIKSFALHIPDELGHRTTWLENICASWMDTHETLPPGLRDININDALIEGKQLTWLIDHIGVIAAEKIPSSEYSTAASHIAQRVLTDIFQKKTES